jgi:hypothetical protein
MCRGSQTCGQQAIDFAANYTQAIVFSWAFVTVLFNAARPGMFDPKGKAKWDAWEKVKGESHIPLLPRFPQNVSSASSGKCTVHCAPGFIFPTHRKV